MKRFVRAPLAVAAVALSLAAPSSAVTCSPDLVLQPLILPTGASADVVLLADFNGDQIPDVVSLSRTFPDFGITIQLGNGDGTFQAPILTATSAVRSLVAGYFNDDAVMDLATGGDGGVVVRLGNGNGTFQPGIPASTDFGTTALAAGDVDGNGTLDLAAVGAGLGILLGNGDGTFQPAVVYAGPSFANGVAAGKFNADGSLDLAVTADSDDNVFLYPGQGNGSFGAAHPIPLGTVLSSPQTADVNGDGKRDLVLVWNQDVVVLLGNGDLTFQPAQTYPAGAYPLSVTPADIDGDGFPDLVAALVMDNFSRSPGAVRILRNDGSGAFVSSGTYALYARPSAPAVGDLDGDENPDVVVGSGAAKAVVALFNLGGGVLASAGVAPAAGGPLLAAGDFDDDGFLDLVLGGDGTGVVIARGGPDGTFTPVPPDPGPPPDVLFLSIAAAADFNGDGHLDVVAVTALYNYKLVFFAGIGDGTFLPARVFDVPGPGLATSGLVPADFDGDGHLDVAISDSDGNSSTGQITVFLGDGQGGFTNTAAMTLDDGLDGGLAVARFDGDTHPDIVAAGGPLFGQTNTLYFLRGHGDGTFDLPDAQPLAARPQALLSGQFRQPGVEDLVMGLGDTTVLLPGNGDGSFGAAQNVADVSAVEAAAADFDGDGKLDVVLADFDSEYVVRNLGAGNFGAPVASPHSGARGPLLAGDLEGNGTVDAVMGASDFGIVVLKNARLGAALRALAAVVGSDAKWLAHASGLGPLTYQWRRGGVPLSDGGRISGSQTGTLTIDPVSFSDAGSYDVIVTDACGSTGSNAATLSVEFADVPASSPFHADILTIASAGITSGCGGGDYCPTSAVRRDQMAVFLLKSEHGADYVPPDCASVFADVVCPGPFTNWIEQLAAEGVTTGCGGNHYCPASSVTRAQMAVFLLKTKNGSAYVPPAATGIFNDVPVGSFAADFIENLYGLGISGGCSASPLLYCPGNPVLRQQMATFLVRTFSP